MISGMLKKRKSVSLQIQKFTKHIRGWKKLKMIDNEKISYFSSLPF